MKKRYLLTIMAMFVCSFSFIACQGTVVVGIPGAEMHVTGLALDSSQNVYVTGYTTGSLDDQIKIGTTDAFVTKYSSLGIRQWTRQIGVANAATLANAIAVDTNGNSYVTGYTTGVFDNYFSKYIPREPFVAKYNSNGEKQWVNKINNIQIPSLHSSSYEGVIPTSIAVDDLGSLYITGYATYICPAGVVPVGAFVARVSSGGQSSSSMDSDYWIPGQCEKWVAGLGIAVNHGGGLFYVTGYTMASIDNQPLTGGINAFVLNFNEVYSGRQHSGTKLFGVPGAATVGSGIAMASTSLYYITGTVGKTDGSNSAFVAQYNKGNFLMTQLGSPNTQTMGNAITLDNNGYCYVTGYTNDNLDGKIRTGRKDTFVAKYNSNLEKQWSMLYGAPDSSTDTIGQGIALVASNDIYVAGTVTTSSASATLDGHPLTANVNGFGTTRFTSVNVPKPDLVISKIWIDRTKMFLDETSSTFVHFTIKNIGIADVSLGSITCAKVNATYNGSSISFSPDMTVNNYTAPLKPGQTVDWQFSVENLYLGSYTLQIKVDSDNAINESSEINNVSDPIAFQIYAHPTNFDVVYYWAPVIQQQARTHNDFFTTVDYDGDWDAANNWDNLGNAEYPLRGAMYYSFIASETHWFIFYGTYFPSDYDCANSHENDFEGSLLIVRRPWPGTDPFVGVPGMYGWPEAIVVQAHGGFSNAVWDTTTWDGDFHSAPSDYGFKLWTFAGVESGPLGRPALSQSCCGHGMELYPNMNNDFNFFCGYNAYTMVYYPSSKSLYEMIPPVHGQTEAEYALVDIAAPGGLADHAGDPLTFSSWRVFNSGDCDDPVHGICDEQGANPPWAWDGDGSIFGDPITYVRSKFAMYQEGSSSYDPDRPYSTKYTFYPYLGTLQQP